MIQYLTFSLYGIQVKLRIQASNLRNYAARRDHNSVIRKHVLLVKIPCRTALKGSFPLNGTYFQVNEVFADHKSSYDPIIVPRELLWNHVKRTLYVGSSTKSIFRDLSLKEIHQNFWTGFTCVKAFERGTGAPKPLARRFHCSASKMEKKGRKKSEKTSFHGQMTILFKPPNFYVG
ncbi:DNA glycosylase/AP lyase ROS1 isoform X2 [Populus alba]|uniref:DNA glycosylase/AP lyase ROS1 isoform X2 n=1 Tax=Populus alba TaxID=43335 RepID=UPI003CC74EC7